MKYAFTPLETSRRTLCATVCPGAASIVRLPDTWCGTDTTWACPASTTGLTHSSKTLGLKALGWRSGFAVSHRLYSSETNRYVAFGKVGTHRPSF